MVSSIGTAISGLNAATKRVDTAAQNIANAQSNTVRINGELQNTPYQAQEITQISNAPGGVTTEQRPQPNPTTRQVSPDDPNADENGTVEVPNVDQAKEIVNLQTAVYDFKANLKSIKTQSAMDKALLDIFA